MTFDPNNPYSILVLTPADITMSFLQKTFNIIDGKKAPMKFSQKVTITKSILDEYNSPLRLMPNIKDIIGTEQTVGRLLVNRFLFDIPFTTANEYFIKVERDGYNGTEGEEDNALNHIPFVDKELSKKELGKVDDYIAELLMANAITSDVAITYINRVQSLGYTAAGFALPSLDINTLQPSKEVIKFREKLFKDNAEVFLNNDYAAYNKIEKELVDFAVADLRKHNAQGLLIYDSGYNGSLANNFKVTSLVRGIAPKSDGVSDYEILTSNLVDGVAKEDIPGHADIAVGGASGRAKDTRMGGYKVKIFNSAFSSMVASFDPNFDCGTKGTIKISLTNDNINDYNYRFIQKGTGFEMIQSSNFKDLVGKTVNMRSPIHCKSSEFCRFCLGDRMRRLKVVNIGLHISRMASAIMMASMKSFHDMSIDPKNINIMDYIEPE